MSTADGPEVDGPDDEPSNESADAPAEKPRPLADAFKQAQQRRKRNVWAHGRPPWLTQIRVTPPVDKIISPEVLRFRASATRINRMVAPKVQISNFGALYRSPLADMVEKFNRTMWEQVAPSFELLHTTIQNLFPANWGDARPRDWDEFEHLLAHEGIPVLWVPGPQIIAAIFEAETPIERRRVINRRWKGVVNDCETVLQGVRHRYLEDERAFALDCVKALREGHTNAAQALAANLLDSIMWKFFTQELRLKLTKNDFKKNGVTFDYDDYSFRLALTFAPVWCAHAKYKPWEGDPIPSEYVRHASVHGVSRRQYTRINAVIALMLVTSVIKFFDVEFARREK
ncbi:hypothetical protein ACFHW2_11995 [Actinomadura sp. LOL_016]|uniref:hypothetical protein n=1 Tax=unclassified Actinomadura TaxID=2626254 RepID=UPI003A7F86CF